ncbi:MAG: hypothetical protein OEY22_01985 [Candidatus Bathyarchaeota archaeon]|nr:hypothetical protein [Candidatus Bathyarchaeota archaeon]MDH5788917.1 hypothetical protein [Candidatus Bathyarchaeota archaeon]
MRKKNKKQKKIDLLKMTDAEKIKLIRDVRQKLRQKIVEEKLWKSFIEAENLTINGEAISRECVNLKGLSFSEVLRNL